MTQLFTNNASSTLASDITAQATSLTLASGAGALFPNPGTGDDFMMTLFQRVGTTELNHEIVLVTARAGDTLTIVRAQEGTLARPFNTGDFAELRLTAGAVLPVRGGQLTGAVNEAQPPTLPSASAMQIGSAKANTIMITGTAIINAFDTAPAGARRCTIFQGVATLTHNTAALTIIGSANVITAAGDVCEWVSTGSGKWTMTSYTRANGDVLGVVSVAHGGTGATDAAGARAALGLANFQDTSTKDTANGYAGLSNYSITLKNATGAVISQIASGAAAACTWTMPNKSGTVALLSDITSGATLIKANGALAGPGHYIFAGQYSVTLPDLTSNPAIALTSAANVVGPISFTTYDQWTVSTGYSNGVTKTLIPLPVGNPRGFWPGMTMTPPGTTLTLSGLAAGDSVKRILGTLSLSGYTIVVFAYGNGTNINIVCINQSTGTYDQYAMSGVSAVSAPTAFSITANGTNSFIICMNSTSGYSQVIPVTINTSTGAISAVGLNNYIAAQSFDSNMMPVMVSAGVFAAFVGGTFYTFTVSGTSFNLVSTISGSTLGMNGSYYRLGLFVVSASLLLLVVVSNTGTGDYVMARTITLNGSAYSSYSGPAYGPIGSLVGSSAKIVGLSATQYCVAATEFGPTDTGYIFALSVNGSAPVFGSSYANPTMGNGNSFNILSLTAFDATKAILTYYQLNGVYPLYALGISVSGTGSGISCSVLNGPTQLATTGASGYQVNGVKDYAGTATAHYLQYCYSSVNWSITKIIYSGNAWAFDTLYTNTSYTVSPPVIFTPTLNTYAVNYGGTWYAWNGLPRAEVAISSSMFLNIASWPSIFLYKNFS